MEEQKWEMLVEYNRACMLPGVDSAILLVLNKLYNCENGHREVVTSDPDIVKRIPD